MTQTTEDHPRLRPWSRPGWRDLAVAAAAGVALWAAFALAPYVAFALIVVGWR